MPSLRERIETRSERLRVAHERAPRGVYPAQVELHKLGGYRHGEPRETSLRRAYLVRWLRANAPSKRGRYASQKPVPRQPEAIKRELDSLGLATPGESGYVARRRAALIRALPLPTVVTKLLPQTYNHVLMDLLDIGPARPGEDPRITRRRRALEKQEKAWVKLLRKRASHTSRAVLASRDP